MPVAPPLPHSAVTVKKSPLLNVLQGHNLHWLRIAGIDERMLNAAIQVEG